MITPLLSAWPIGEEKVSVLPFISMELLFVLILIIAFGLFLMIRKRRKR